ncbi:MAG: LD-carboxypeptidase [Cytophagaceae bacterium]
MSIAPPFLKKGDKVAVVAPAKKIVREEILPGLEILKSWGLQVITGKYLYNEYNQFAGTDGERLEDLQQLIDDPNIKGVFAARGGYGTNRIIDKLDFSGFKNNPKWIIGFSDLTILLNHVHQWGIESIHGPMPLLFGDKTTKESLEYLRKILFGENIEYLIPGNRLNIRGIGSGELIGGNLSILCTMIGTPSDVNSEGKILFLEEIDEHIYHLDRMMVMLKRAGKLKGLSGMLIGHMSDMKESGFGKTYQEVILEHTQAYNFPICFGFPAGHEPKNYPILIGKKAVLEVQEETVRLSFPSSYSL